MFMSHVTHTRAASMLIVAHAFIWTACGDEDEDVFIEPEEAAELKAAGNSDDAELVAFDDVMNAQSGMEERLDRGTLEAATISITSTNSSVLASGCYDSKGYLYWTNECGTGKYGGSSLSATKKQKITTVSGITGTQLADSGGNNYGECVSMVKALSGVSVGTSSWKKGVNVVLNKVTTGTAIATFNSSGGYSGHTAFFIDYVKTNNIITGIKVWDQNWSFTNGSKGNGAVMAHTISTTTSSTNPVSDADNYHVLQY